MQKVITTLVTLCCLLSFSPSSLSNEQSVADITESSEVLEGFIPLFWQSQTGRIFADIASVTEPFIYYTGLARGVGSNDLGLDRGRLGDTQLVYFDRIGSKVLLKAENTRYIARSDNAAERLAVTEAFAQSVLWGFAVAAEGDGKVLIDLTDFALRDHLGLGNLLKRRDEGSYSLDQSRSAIYRPRTKSFPDNTELEAILTLTGTPSGNIIGTVTPDAQAITVHGHQSFVRLPDEGYEPLPFDPRAGYIDSGEASLVYDYSSPISASIKTAFARRHRLEKVDPNAESSPAKEPIIYWVDSGVPEPIKSALIEGASWWNQAFEAAGYEDAFQVRVLPEGADPMDIRYNVIQWVHRSTRGWSYGASIRDPRTQEILKGHVTLGSLRVRQDYLIAEGLLSPYDSGGSPDAELAEFALSRIRQLSAHEVGHTIGLAHNFAASADDRASVMDYPHPLVTLSDDGQAVLDDAYDDGIGEWDKRAIIWGYQDFPADVDRAAAREQIMGETIASGLRYVADEHARISGRSGAGPAHPFASLWDNGDDPVAELTRVMTLRNAVLENFSESAIPLGAPMAKIEDVLVPTYLMHRYQVEAAATVLGGQVFSYALRGDGQPITASVGAEDQRAALAAMLATLDPIALDIPDRISSMIPPRPPQSGVSRELFPRHTGYVFDPIAAAATAAEVTLAQLLDAKRAARLNNQYARDNKLPSFSNLLAILIDDGWPRRSEDRFAVIERQTQALIVDRLILLMRMSAAATQVRADAMDALVKIGDRASNSRQRSAAGKAHMRFLAARIEAALANAEAFESLSVKVPPGSPI